MGWKEAVVNFACFGKQAFTSKLLAQKVANRVNRRNQGGHAGRVVYRCPKHQLPTWHIGNNFLRRDKKLARKDDD